MDFFISDLSSYEGYEIVGFQLPKSSGYRPNLREWWVGEKISLDYVEGEWLSIAFGNQKNNGKFEPSHPRGQIRILKLNWCSRAQEKNL